LSGFVCILHGDDAPVERALLQSLTDFLSFRGTDARDIWLDGSIGMGHALLQTTYEAKDERQPAGLEGRYRIVADACLDSREELITKLQQKERAVRSNAPDCELILHAYAVWGTSCIDHLRGDFSFALWDATHKQLFCARDHFGIKPFYYAKLGETFLCSNTLNCIRLYPGVTAELNDAAVGDFLLFGLNYDNATTIFRDIQRLPPAHARTVSSRGAQVRRYWAPPTDGRIRYSRPAEYVENFQAILEKAVADRLRTDRVGILLSGGLDSSSIAAVAKEAAGRSGSTTEIRAYTLIYESLIPDREKEYARDTAEFLRIPVRFIAMDGTKLFERGNDAGLTSPEPIDDPLFARVFDSYREMSAGCRVLLSGEGNDNLMNFQMWSYVRDLAKKGEWRRLSAEVANYLWIRPFPWRGIRARVLRFARRDPLRPVFPPWLAPEFSLRMNLPGRWKEGLRLPKSWMTHPIHPWGHASFSLPSWTRMFEQENAGVTHYPLETRYPFLDLRMVSYLLALPPFPWFFRKMLLREAMTGKLPERVRMRPKTPLQGFPAFAMLQRTGAEQLKQMSLSRELDRYVERSALAPPQGGTIVEEVNAALRPYLLNVWLQSVHKVRYKIPAEVCNG
jgi:asparagine synthase (glutamine-hydrolysing)